MFLAKLTKKEIFFDRINRIYKIIQKRFLAKTQKYEEKVSGVFDPPCPSDIPPC